MLNLISRWSTSSLLLFLVGKVREEEQSSTSDQNSTFILEPNCPVLKPLDWKIQSKKQAPGSVINAFEKNISFKRIDHLICLHSHAITPVGFVES